MGSPEPEPWRSEDEMIHTVTLGDFYIGQYKVIQHKHLGPARGTERIGISPDNTTAAPKAAVVLYCTYDHAFKA